MHDTMFFYFCNHPGMPGVPVDTLEVAVMSGVEVTFVVAGAGITISRVRCSDSCVEGTTAQ